MISRSWISVLSIEGIFNSLPKMHVVCLALILILNLTVIRVSSSILLDGDEDLPRMKNFAPVDVPALIAQENYPSETHKVTTKDGYILTVFRIPGPPDSPAVFFQHGLLECSTNWLITGRGNSLAFILSDLGYDVWLGNARGSTHSKEHVNLTTSDPKYWNFRWDELAIYDLPAVITYVTDLKQDKLFYIGHSMGVTTFAAMAIDLPEIAERVNLMIGVGPAVYLTRISSPVRLLAPLWREVQLLAKTIGLYELLPRSILFDLLAKYVCKTLLVGDVACNTPLFLIGGPNIGQVDPSVQPKIYSTFPAGTSIGVFIQYLQQINVDKFRKFDFGTQGNLMIYNSLTPPYYDLSKLRVPVALFYTLEDWLADPEGVKEFYAQVPMKAGIYEINNRKFNHFDFLWGRDAPALVYSKITDLIAQFNNSHV